MILNLFDMLMDSSEHFIMFVFVEKQQIKNTRVDNIISFKFYIEI